MKSNISQKTLKNNIQIMNDIMKYYNPEMLKWMQENDISRVVKYYNNGDIKDIYHIDEDGDKQLWRLQYKKDTLYMTNIVWKNWYQNNKKLAAPYFKSGTGRKKFTREERKQKNAIERVQKAKMKESNPELYDMLYGKRIAA